MGAGAELKESGGRGWGLKIGTLLQRCCDEVPSNFLKTFCKCYFFKESKYIFLNQRVFFNCFNRARSFVTFIIAALFILSG